MVKKGWIIAIVIILIFNIFYINASEPAKPCEEKISINNNYETLILSNDVIKRLNTDFQFLKISLDNCFNGGGVQGSLSYKLPQNYSEFNITYIGVIPIVYHKDNTINFYYSYDKTDYSNPNIITSENLSYDRVISKFKREIQVLENNKKIREFISKISPLQDTTIGQSTKYSNNPGYNSAWLEYRFDLKAIREYLLPNSIVWNNFLEIIKVHEIIKNNLLIGELSSCTIDNTSYTLLQFYDGEGTPYHLTVQLKCNDGVKAIKLRLYENGSYDNMRVEDYKVKTSAIDRGINDFRRDYMPYIVLGTPIIIIGIILFFIFKKKKSK